MAFTQTSAQKYFVLNAHNVTLKITLCTWEEQTQLKCSWLRGIGYFRGKKNLPSWWCMVRYNIWVMEIAGETWFNYSGCSCSYTCSVRGEAEPHTAQFLIYPLAAETLVWRSQPSALLLGPPSAWPRGIFIAWRLLLSSEEARTEVKKVILVQTIWSRVNQNNFNAHIFQSGFGT